MPDAYDFSWARPDFTGIPVRLVLAYANGGKPTPTVEYMAGLRAQGIGICLGWETTPFRSLDGYEAGRVDAARFESEVVQVGYPSDVACWACASDGNRGTPGPDPAITAYFQGWAEVMHPDRPGVVAYGNRSAIDMARQAARVLGGWCPSTWNRTDEDLLIQHADGDGGSFPGSAALPGTDANTIQHDFAWWGATPPPPKEEPEMFVLKAGSGAAYITDGLTKRYIGDPAELAFWTAAGVKEIAAGDDVLARIPDYATLEDTPLVVPPLAATSSATAKNMANVLRKTTIGKK